ncbi:MAG TPA: serine/threonine-protein kinase [Polyangia bacterium]|nr:serine/threonine-protein kinase [Polyangia bacterium]
MAPDSYTGQHPSGPGDGVGHLGRYQVIGRLATGGMAEVYLALSGELSGYRTLVVVKRILPHLASNQEFIRMFLDEARIAALLDHPNVVRIIEVGHDGDEYFLVMELVQGKPLSGITRKAAKDMNPLTPALSAYIIAQAANGLGYAHDLVDSEGRPLGVVHRDVSPQNILVSFEGAVKVIDFGIVRALGRVSQTNPGGLKGKIEYMSPEQASSEDVDRRADVFALGVVLWEAVTGRHLFRRDTELATMRAIVDEPIPPPSDITPVVPQLEQIIVRALQKRREDRFQTAQEMAMALERYAFAAEGFSPLLLANYVKGLFDVEFTQWKKTVSSALDIEPQTGGGTQSGTRFPVIKPDLPTRGPTVALRKGQSSSQIRAGLPGSDSGVRRDTDLRTDAPTRGDRIWVYGGVSALALIVLVGAFVLSRPRAPLPISPLAPAAPTQWQSTPPVPTPPSTPIPSPTPSAAAPGPSAPPAPEATSAAASKPDDRARPEAVAATRARVDKAHGKARVARHAAAQAPGVPSDHRPNPFD